MEFRKAQGDPWDWQIYQVVVGDDVGDFYAASWNHTWEDFDSYDAFEGGEILSAHFQATVGPTLEDMTTVITDGSQGIKSFPKTPTMRSTSSTSRISTFCRANRRPSMKPS